VSAHDSLRALAYRQLDPRARTRNGLSPVNLFLAGAIVAAAIAAIVETEPLLAAGREHWFRRAELLFGALFTIEYVARLWSVVEDRGEQSGGRRRLRFAVTPSAILDLLAIVVTFAPFLGVNAMALRLIRLLRILRLAKLGRLSSSMRHLSRPCRHADTSWG
jgi:voltage-gated potassium channel